MATTLWHFRYSHCNEKARWALDYKGWPHDRRALVPGFHVVRMLRVSGQPKTPVLELDGEIIVGSANIIAALERRQPNPPLYPADREQRDRALELEAWFDEHAADDLRRLFYASYLPHARACSRMSTAGFGRGTYLAFRGLYPLLVPVMRLNMGIFAKRVAAARHAVERAFDKLEAELQPSGYLVGDDFNVADLTAAALLSLVVRPAELPYELPDPPPAELLALRDELSQRPGFAWVEQMFRRHRAGTTAPAG